MGNLETKIFRVCGSAIKQNKLDTQEMKEEEEDNVFIERNRDKYFQKGDYKKILEKFPEYKNWTEHGMNPSTDEKQKQKRIRWKQGEVIGHGSFGKVVMGLNLQTGCMMAVKQVQIGAVNTSAQQERIKALEVEIELLSQFSHKNIVRYYGSDSTKDTFNIFLEYISGGTIASLLDKYGPFNENLIRVYTRQILQGLEYLHVRNTIHRDIKGANVLVDNSGICKLTDFGTAKRISSLVESDSKYLPSIRGTVNWMAPEVIRQSNLGRYCDIWSVGCTVIEMATGKAPWATLLNSNATSVSLLYQIAQAKSPPPFPKGLSNEAIDFLKQCFRINPQERPNVIKLLNHRFLSSVVFYKHIDLPRDPKQEIAPKEALEQHIRVYSDREKTTAGEKYTLKRKASSSKEPIHHNDIDISPFKITENKNVLSQQTSSIPPSIPKKGELYITKEEDDTPKRPVRPQQNRKLPSASEISQREDKSKVEHTELKGLAPNDLSDIESPAILHNLTDRFRSIIEEEKDKPIFRVPLDPRGNPESKVRSRPLGKNKRLLLKKGGYSNLSEDESIAGNSFMLIGSPEAIHEVNEDKATSGGSTKGNKSSLFKAPFAWPDNLGENENGNDEEREHIVIESDQEEDSDQETSEQAEKQRNGRKQHRRESLHNLSNTSVHSNPETHTIEEPEDKKKSIMNKENLEAEFDSLFTEQRNPLSLKSMNQIVEKKIRTDSNVSRRLPNALGKVKSPITGVRSEEEIRVVYKQPLTDLEERRNIHKGKKLEHSLAPQNLKLIDD